MEQLLKVMELSKVLNSTLEQEEVYHRAIQVATDLMRCEVGSLLLYDKDAGELFFHVALGEKGEAVKAIRLKMGEGIAGWVARNRTPAVVNDTSQDPRFFSKADSHSGFVTRNVICVPILRKGRLLGVLQAINRHDGTLFNKDDVALFSSLADQVAIALENAALYAELRETFISTAEAMAEAIEMRDPYTGGHIKRVQEYAVATGMELGLDGEELELLRLVAILHDIGKIGVDDSILKKPGPLTPEEAKIMQEHPVHGEKILEHIKALRFALPGMMHHHERVDGKGYPSGLSGDAIPLHARIIAVADTYDAMTSDRPYRKGLSRQTALDEIHRCSSTQFDPAVADAFCKALAKLDQPS
ncbi:MAG: GAF domain-containing protein [Nitrospirota bacterium]|nr:GAF domain-containing protein [Nitrospirota bacterium]